MAAATVASTEKSVFGNKRIVTAILTAPADTNTWATGLTAITSVQITANGALAAADSVGYTKSGGTITFSVVGTARDLDVLVIGI